MLQSVIKLQIKEQPEASDKNTHQDCHVEFPGLDDNQIMIYRTGSQLCGECLLKIDSKVCCWKVFFVHVIM